MVFQRLASAMLAVATLVTGSAHHAPRFSAFKAKPPIHVRGLAQPSPSGLTPAYVKAAYHLPTDGGTGTIAVVDAYDDPSAAHDLDTFSTQFNLPTCGAVGGCFEKHKMQTKTATNAGWALETSLDIEWAHAIAPKAKILLIEAASDSGTNLLKAVDYAAKRADVVAVSMSWGGNETSDEASLDSHFISKSGATFFTSSGDNGAGVSWPAVSPNVVGVGGTTLNLDASGHFSSETAWSGSGGGISAYESEPTYQSDYKIAKAGGKRAVPDVSFNADPATGYPVYRTPFGAKSGRWWVVGGTSAGAPQWAAIKALGGSAANDLFYADKAATGHAGYFRDIVSGSNGDCTYFCDARRRYDEVTGLGTPLRAAF